VAGAFLPCEACDGSGEILVAVTSRFGEAADAARPCARCEGYGSVWADDAGSSGIAGLELEDLDDEPEAANG
jgi:hypothetical protein